MDWIEYFGLALDPYAGSGTSLFAARESGRRWVGVELKPSFVDLIERRMDPDMSCGASSNHCGRLVGGVARGRC